MAEVPAELIHGTKTQRVVARKGYNNTSNPLAQVRIPLMADSDSIPIADSVPGDGGHAARVS
ncbi:hypothetical protein F3K02_17955 [Hydrogenophaga sp. D2P1]|uniref:Uncharacterized protein n=1 Tax=Hydrogenophaga aromaticivorans TaxID=2610898 RepID=A0A7Y8GYA5_9BURK|nr:hypothetical protein [Hydrogenophaga aromaticivorans]